MDDIDKAINEAMSGPAGKSQRYWDNIDKLKLARYAISKDKSYAKRAHEKVDWKKVNGSKDNKNIHKHRMKKVYVYKFDTDEFVGEYESEMEASRQLGVSQGNINSGLDKPKMRKGFKFTTKKLSQ